MSVWVSSLVPKIISVMLSKVEPAMFSLKVRHNYSLLSHCIRVVTWVALIFLVTVACFSPGVFASDAPSVEWSQTYNGLRGLSVMQTSDGGYVVAGSSYSPGIATLIKTDMSGTAQWQKAQGNIKSVAQTSDSGFVLFRDSDIVKTNAQGETEAVRSPCTSKACGKGFSPATETTSSRATASQAMENTSSGCRNSMRKATLYGTTLTQGVSYSTTIVETDDRGCALAGNWKT
jgi:hypothetical protein